MAAKKTLKHITGKRVHIERGSAVPFVTLNNNTRKVQYKLPINLLQPKNLLKATQKNKANQKKSQITITMVAQTRKQLNANKRKVLAERQRAMEAMQKATVEAGKPSLSAHVTAKPPPVVKNMSNFASFLNRSSKAAKARKTAKAAAKLRGENSNSNNNSKEGNA